MILLLTAFFCLATSISANKVLLFSLAPELLVTIRMIVASPLLAAYGYYTEKRVVSLKVLRDYFSWMVIIALFTTFFPSNLKAYALANMPSYKMAYFGTLDPFVAALYSFFLFRERLTVRQWCGILLGACGMLILCMSTSTLEQQLQAFSFFSYPELAALCAIVLSRLGWIQGQQLLKKEHMTPLQFNIVTMALGGIFSLALVLLRGTYTMQSFETAHLPILGIYPLAALSSEVQVGLFLGYTIGLGNMVGYMLYAHALKRYSATFIALTGFTIPLTVQLVGWALLGESLSLPFFAACGITLLGIGIFYYDESSRVGVISK